MGDASLNMQLRLLSDWRGMRAGKVFRPMSTGAGKLLVRRKIAEQIDLPKPQEKPQEKKQQPARYTKGR